MARRQYDPTDRALAFSRTMLDDFMECPRCFYLHRRLRHAHPDSPSSRLPNRVGALLQAEFDRHRREQTPHPVMRDLPGDLVPFDDPRMDDFRKSARGVRYLHAASGLEFYGAPDDIWRDRSSELLHVVDYKTSSSEGGASLTGELGPKYEKQVEVYQYLLRNNGLDVSDTAYFLFEYPAPEDEEFGGVLRFEARVIAHTGDTSWIEEQLLAARACLDADAPPAPTPGCEWCSWVAAVSEEA